MALQIVFDHNHHVWTGRDLETVSFLEWDVHWAVKNHGYSRKLDILGGEGSQVPALPKPSSSFHHPDLPFSPMALPHHQHSTIPFLDTILTKLHVYSLLGLISPRTLEQRGTLHPYLPFFRRPGSWIHAPISHGIKSYNNKKSV